jgi:hypothetical protein
LSPGRSVLRVYSDEQQVHAKVQELNETTSGLDDPHYYYVAADLIDPRQS